jgi:hypothetical protein
MEIAAVIVVVDVVERKSTRVAQQWKNMYMWRPITT